MLKLRNLFAVGAMAVTLAVPAQAQSTGPVDFWFRSLDDAAPGVYDDFEGSFTSADAGFFQVFCVHKTQLVDNPDSFDAYLTDFTASFPNQAENPNGNVWLGNYFQAAEIASLLAGNRVSGVFNDAEVDLIQQAIWHAMGFATDGGQANYDAWYAVYQNGPQININNWFVITDAAGVKQEFIAFRDTPFETVPEPATMTLMATGLAGLAAARRRRKS